MLKKWHLPSSVSYCSKKSHSLLNPTALGWLVQSIKFEMICNLSPHFKMASLREGKMKSVVIKAWVLGYNIARVELLKRLQISFRRWWFQLGVVKSSAINLAYQSVLFNFSWWLIIEAIFHSYKCASTLKCSQ